MTTTIFLVDDNEHVQARLDELLEGDVCSRVVEEADVIAAVRRAIRAAPASKVLVLSQCSERGFVLGCLKAGAFAFLLEDRLSEDLAVALAALARGNMFLSPGVTDVVLDECLDY